MKRSALFVVVALAGCGSTATSSPGGSGPAHGAGAASGTGAAMAAPVVPADKAATPAEPRPPVAAQRPFILKSPNGDRSDPYYWLRDDTRKSSDVLGYLDAENAYAQAILGPDKPVEDKLVAEMRSHIQDDDTSVPVLDNGYWYYARFAAGQEQPVYVRRKGTMAAAEEVVLDGNELA